MKKLLIILIALFLPILTLAQDKYLVNTQELNVRSRPSAKSSVVGKLKQGEIVTVFAIANGWASIKYKSKPNYCYVAARYLEKIESDDNNWLTTDDNNVQSSQVKYQEPAEHNLTNNRKQKTDSHNTDSFDDMLSIFVDGFGGMTSFAWSNNTPVAVFSYGGDLGFRWKYCAFSHSIPNGLFGDISVGYSHRGCNAYPIDYGTAHLFPLGYSKAVSNNFGFYVKVGGYFLYPLSSKIANQYKTNPDYGVAGVIGVTYKRISLGFSYERGFADVSDAPATLYNQGGFATLSYHFKVK